ncbi:hypothetical protein [Nonlabens sp.]|uniref:hypothetical protein n=1 Tax=Nonlabens sp. TaxID=1888209 RepID=UPI003F696084
MKSLHSILLLAILAATITSCSTDFKRVDIKTTNLSGFIEGGNAGGVYGNANLKITLDSIQMTDWPVSKLTNNLNTLLDTTLVDQTSFTDFYTIQMANDGDLKQREFIDSLVIQFTKNGLMK